MLYSLMKIEYFQFLNFQWTFQLREPYGSVLRDLLPPLLIVGCNSLILLVIDFICLRYG